MNGRRAAAAVVLSVVIAAVLGVIVYTEHANATATVGVLVLTRDVTGGAPYAASDVQRVEIHANQGSFNYETSGPDVQPSRYARDLSAGDILRRDDLVPASAQAEVAVTVQAAPALTAGDTVDVFAAYAGQQALIGRGVRVETVNAGALTLLVPVADEQAWVAVGSSNVPLHVARVAAGAHADGPPVGADDAIRLLCGSPCGAAGPSLTGTP